jgi:hypothetical protein
MTRALVRRRVHGDVIAKQTNPYSKWQKAKTALEALVRLHSPEIAFAKEGLRREAGSKEQQDAWRGMLKKKGLDTPEKLVELGLYKEALGPEALQAALVSGGPYRSAVVSSEIAALVVADAITKAAKALEEHGQKLARRRKIAGVVDRVVDVSGNSGIVIGAVVGVVNVIGAVVGYSKVLSNSAKKLLAKAQANAAELERLREECGLSEEACSTLAMGAGEIRKLLPAEATTGHEPVGVLAENTS